MLGGCFLTKEVGIIVFKLYNVGFVKFLKGKIGRFSQKIVRFSRFTNGLFHLQS